MPKRRRADPPSSGASDIEPLLERFELAWQSDAPPAIESFLPAHLAGRRRLLRELVMIDLEYRWRRTARGPDGGVAWPARPLLEDYAARLPRLGPAHRLPVGLVGEEYRVRQRWGDRPGHAEYARRFPRHGAALRDELDRIDADLRDERPTEFAGEGRPPRVADDIFTPPASLDLRCPHCRQVIEVAADLTPRDLACPACGGAFGVEALSTAPGRGARPPSRRLGRYELGRLLGTGAFGSVWQAWDAGLAREVAVKLPRSGRFSGPADEEERFLREARSAAQLHHPGIVAVYDVGRDQDTLYIVSELVRGASLAERLREGRLGFREAAALLAQAADALDYAHRRGVVHRDLKPANVLLPRGDGGRKKDEKGRYSPDSSSALPSSVLVKVADFGLALRDAAEVTMTMDGQVLGTPAYMSPEQVRNPHAVDGRSDVYSLGVILYELLTGELPFRGTTQMVLLQAASDEPRPPRRLNDRIPRDLETVCLKCLSKRPQARYRTAGALAADLRRWLGGEPTLARPVGPAERLWLWSKRHAALTLIGGLGVAALAAVTGAPAALALTAAAAGALLFALHKARAAAELAHAVEDGKRSQKRTAAALQYAFRHYTRARDERRQAAAAEARARRRFNRLRELARAVLFDLPDRVTDAPARALLVGAALTYLDGLAKETGDDDALRRELALAYDRAADVQGDAGDAADALASRRKALEIFEALAAAHPGNAQSRRDLEASRAKAAEMERVQKTEGGGQGSAADPPAGAGPRGRPRKDQ